MAYLLQNAIHIFNPDTYLVSRDVHDFVTHVFEGHIDPSNRRTLEIGIDGGTEYCRRVGALYDANVLGLYEEWCLTSDDPFHPTVVEKLLWGTRGKDGDQPLTFRPISEFSVEHLQAILDNCPGRSGLHDKVIRYWITRKTETTSPLV